ncbi:MAG: xanthine dehydrogenase molybdenum-binding subunit [Chloroflexota bacterium]|jgi:CO/xanthine dehydrogenase Mo-binding subunit|nr:xanthine dehydrogenase molybdenum-binding subunit [Chloroflexota bacterium]
MTATEEKLDPRLQQANAVLSEVEYSVVGTRPIRHDGVDKVTGRAVYGADVRLTGMLYGRVLRSPHAHARIVRIDASRAEALPGVKAIVTGRDFPQAGGGGDEDEDTGNIGFLRANMLANTKALYQGHPVAAVAATSARIAEEALKLIDVAYEVLPPVVDGRQAMRADAPLLHETLRTDSLGATSDRPSNVARHMQNVLGDPAQGFREAAIVVEREFTTATVHQGYIEPHAATALWNADGELTVWCSTQGAFGVRDSLARLLDYPVSRIHVNPTEIGGGFGGKLGVRTEPIAALLTRKCGRPVRVVMGRSDVFRASGPAPGSWTRVKIGAMRDGRLVAAEAELVYEAGAFPGSSIGGGMRGVFACYDVPNVRIDGYDVVVNKPKSAAYRAPGTTQAVFATEQVIDELAEQVGMDPIEFRILNSARHGTRRADGTTHTNIGSLQVLEAMQNHPHYNAPLAGPHRGRGVAFGYWNNGGNKSSCTISVSNDGRVQLVEGSVDIGGTRAAVAMQAAEVLGIAAHDVRPVVVGTDGVGYTSNTGGSRTAFATGVAAIEAAHDVVRQMKARAAILWEVAPERVEFAAGTFADSEDAARRLTFKELAAQLDDTGGPITGRSNVQPRGRGGAFVGCIADVEVDPDTGKTTILRFTALQDAGKAVHPSYVEGQMQGGGVQGIGWALNEEYVMDEAGRMMNASFLDYRMPTSLDVPMIDTVIVEVANPGHPFGVRGVGEAPIVPPPAAIANALYRATGVRLRDLPMSPRRILEATGKIEGVEKPR